MRTSLFKRLRWGLIPALLILLAAGGAPGARVAAQTPPESGVICTTSSSPNATFTLTAKSGYVSTPDGNTIFMWSYAPGSGAFQLPGPNLCVNQGDTVTIVLNNTLLEPVSIVFPGQDGVLANGAPAMPQFDGGGNLTSLTNSAPARVGSVNGSVTYSFTASEPGTYLYHSGTDIGKQVQMGLYGALIVRPSMGANFAYNRADTQFNAGTEYVMLMSEVDPALHQAVERNRVYNYTAYHPRYWMINGRSFPDTIAPNGAAWLPTQPYSAFVHMRPKAASGPDAQPALVRYLNVGTLNHPFHPHGNHGRVIARDGRVLAGLGGQDLSYEKFLVLLGSGQTWDATYTWTDVELWNPTSNTIPVPLPQQQNLTYKDNATWYSGSPYLGYQDDLPTGVTSYNECGEYYHVWHSHALNEAANYEAGFGGMFTLQRIDPPSGCP
jgi:FtsP/CotA-like multicopper oxidase with cupredoxin domain